MHAKVMGRVSRLALGVSVAAFALAACSKETPEQSTTAPAATQTAAATTDAAPAAAPAAAAAPAPDNVDTVAGVKFASFTGDATKGAGVFITCKTCHAVEEGVNKIGPSLHNVVGRKAGEIANYNYTAANKNSGITWTEEKLFQYLEAPQRVVPGTKMAFAGLTDPQKRADVIAYLKAN